MTLSPTLAFRLAPARALGFGPKPSRPVPLSLALQGGGAHGAYTWGVLDALLDSGRVEPTAISGASAGAVNAVVLAHGWLQGGAAGARAALDDFWRKVGLQLPGWLQPWLGGTDAGSALSATARLVMHWTQFLAPTQINPLQIDPLRRVLQEQVDFAALRRSRSPRLFIATTNALTGRLRLFTNAQLSADVVLASACLPSLHHAVEIDGEPYWDGGYSANPPLFPLVREAARDCLIVVLSPMRHATAPTSAAAIRARVAEIAFNATFLREARLMGELCAAARPLPRPWRWLLPGRWGGGMDDLRFHLIDAQADLGHLAPETRLVAHVPFLEQLHGLGAARARAWLEGPGRGLGRTASVDLRTTFS